MSGSSNSKFHSRRVRWQDEEPLIDSNSSPFVWQHPTRWAELYEEPSSDDEGIEADEIIDTTSIEYVRQRLARVQQQHSSFAIAGPSAVRHESKEREGYMEQSSLFAPDITPSESTFLESFPKGSATITYHNGNHELESIHNVNLSLVQARCPVLGVAFEDSRSGPRLYLETLTSTTALPLLRFLYSGTYALRVMSGDIQDFYEDVPTSILLHCQLYWLADIYDLQDLKSQAYVNVLRQCEFGCSSPEKPIDLCAAVRFAYRVLREHENLIDAIVNYCVACFLRHELARDKEFKQLAYDLRPFHQDLCKNCMNREFENETAAAIIQMPFKPYIPQTYASREDVEAQHLSDVVYHFHASDEMDHSPKKRKRAEIQLEQTEGITLPLRPYEKTATLPKTEPQVEDEHHTFESKRRASVGASSAPVWSGISQLRAVLEQALCSDADYEFVEGPGPVEEASDSDDDANDPVEVMHEGLGEHSSYLLPTRRRELLAATGSVSNAAENDLDSEWTLI